MSDLNLTGFLFGNIDEEGKLEDDFLDEELRSAINKKGFSQQLSLDIGIQKEDIEVSSANSGRISVHKTQVKLDIESAIDFSNIDEAVPDNETIETIKDKPSKKTSDSTSLDMEQLAPDTKVNRQSSMASSRFRLTSDGRFLRYTEFFAGGHPAHTAGKYRMRRLRPKKRKGYTRPLSFVLDQVEIFRKPTLPSSQISIEKRPNLFERYLMAAQTSLLSCYSDGRPKTRKVQELERIFTSRAENPSLVHKFPLLAHPSILQQVPDINNRDWRRYHPLNLLDWENDIIYDSTDLAPRKAPRTALNSLYAGVITNSTSTSTAPLPPSSSSSTAPHRSASTSVPASRPTSPSGLPFSSLPVPGVPFHRLSQPSLTSPHTTPVIMSSWLPPPRSASMTSSRSSTPGFVSPTNTTSGGREALAPKSLAGRILNHELLASTWINQIIWDADQLSTCLPSVEIQLPLNDPNLIFETPPDALIGVPPSLSNQSIMLSPTGMTTLPTILQKSESAMATTTASAIAATHKSRPKSKTSHTIKGTTHPVTIRFDRCLASEKFNLSNDKYYFDGAGGGTPNGIASKDKTTALVSSSGRAARAIMASASRIGVQHAIPALKLQMPFYRTFWTKNELRTWHRPRLDVSSLIGKTITFDKWIRTKESAVGRKPVATLINSAKRLSLRDRSILNGSSGTSFILLEYCEEFPLLMMNVGMATFLFNVYRKSQPKDHPPSNLADRPYGISRILEPQETSPFWIFGDVRPGQTLPIIQNNLFRAPLFDHATNPTDFLLVKYNVKGKTQSRFFLKPLPEITSVVGQVFPTAEVYGPHSRRHNAFCRARIQAFAYRLFRKDQPNWADGNQSAGNLPRLKISKIMAAFPQFSEGSLRKWLKEYADSVRAGQEGGGGTWRMRSDAPILTEEEIRALVTPEMICQYESMLAGQQRLNDAGLMEAPEMEMLVGEDETSRTVASATTPTSAIEGTLSEANEVRLAPWALSANFISATMSRCNLQLRGSGDPSGRGEAFSFVRIPTKMSIGGKLSSLPEVSSSTTETTAPTSSEAKGKLSKEQVAYRQEIVKIWDAQSKALSNSIPPALQEDSTIGENTADFSIFEDTTKVASQNGVIIDEETASVASRSSVGRTSFGRTMIIIRIIRDPNTGLEREEQETITDNPRLISAYVNQRRGWERKRKRRQIAALASAARAKKPRSAKVLTATVGGKLLKVKVPKRPKKEVTVKCGTCGELGHMKTNRICPRYAEYEASLATAGETLMPNGNDPTGGMGLKISINKAILKTTPIEPTASAAPVPPIIVFKPRKRKGLDFTSLTSEQREAATKLSEHYLKILDVLTESEGSWPFHRPVSKSEYPHYYRIITKPLDFSTIRSRIRRHYYGTLLSFLDDLRLIRDNCVQFNGPDHPFSVTITKLMEMAEQLLNNGEVVELNKRISGPEVVDPTDDDDHVNID